MALKYNERTGEFEESGGARQSSRKSGSSGSTTDSSTNDGCSTAIGCLFWILVIIGIIKGCS